MHAFLRTDNGKVRTRSELATTWLVSLLVSPVDESKPHTDVFFSCGEQLSTRGKRTDDSNTNSNR